MNSKHRKTLEQVWSEPVNGNLAWAGIEALLKALGCRVIEGAGSAVTFERSGRRLFVHRPHPANEALRYRVNLTRDFLSQMGIKP